MITDKEAEAAANFLRDKAPEYAQAKGERVYLEQFRKSKKALLIQNTEGTVLERESAAYAHPEYQELLEGLRAAVEREEELRWMMVAAQTKIEVWRSQQATNRAIDRGHQ